MSSDEWIDLYFDSEQRCVMTTDGQKVRGVRSVSITLTPKGSEATLELIDLPVRTFPSADSVSKAIATLQAIESGLSEESWSGSSPHVDPNSSSDQP